jgi:hypothetical protein
LKFHCQEVGLPVEVSVNCTADPAVGEAGLWVKDAVGGESIGPVSLPTAHPLRDTMISIRTLPIVRVVHLERTDFTRCDKDTAQKYFQSKKNIFFSLIKILT